jgi:hypothetical protein
MRDVVLLRAQAVLFVGEFFLVAVEGNSILLEFVDLDYFAVEDLLELFLLCLCVAQLVGAAAHFDAEGIDLFLELVCGF